MIAHVTRASHPAPLSQHFPHCLKKGKNKMKPSLEVVQPIQPNRRFKTGRSTLPAAFSFFRARNIRRDTIRIVDDRIGNSGVASSRGLVRVIIKWTERVVNVRLNLFTREIGKIAFSPPWMFKNS